MQSSDIAISYSKVISYENNHVFQMVSDAFYLLGLDKENYGTKLWNPLGEYVNPGDRVLIKPNLVMHNNPSGDGGECLYTQPSVLNAVIEYVITALKGSGSIIVGDAPMQMCHFDVLVEESGLKFLVDEYRRKGIDIRICDFRNTISNTVNGIVIEKKVIQNESIVVDLGKHSSFSGLSQERIQNMRVTNYDPGILQEHHTMEKHEYMIAKEVLDADVVINMPKPKTHRKAGITGALKNLVGMNCCKEYLPHHTRQNRKVHGDDFYHKSLWLRLADDYLDKKCKAEKCHCYKKAMFFRYVGGVCQRIGKKITHEKYSEGSWYGNDTIWRTIMDMNKLLQYSDKNGIICNERQRKIFHIGDMIVSGEKDGPICPSRKEAGIIIAGEDPCSFDEVVAALMGFDGKMIPTIRNMRQVEPKIYFHKEYQIISNNLEWDGRKFFEICKDSSLNFLPNPGWDDVLSFWQQDNSSALC